MHDSILVEGITEPQLKLCSSWVDVRDLAGAHVRALRLEEAGSERIIISAGMCPTYIPIFSIYVDLAD
jgi:nucleoside-diphosphate-sugar epimerase